MNIIIRYINDGTYTKNFTKIDDAKAILKRISTIAKKITNTNIPLFSNYKKLKIPKINIEVPTDYPDGCHLKAEILANILESEGHNVKKIFVFGGDQSLKYTPKPEYYTDKLINGGKDYWGYHVAPIIEYKEGEEIIRKVIDPFFDEPLTIDEWLAKMEIFTKHECSFTDIEEFVNQAGVLTGNGKPGYIIVDKDYTSHIEIRKKNPSADPPNFSRLETYENLHRPIRNIAYDIRNAVKGKQPIDELINKIQKYTPEQRKGFYEGIEDGLEKIKWDNHKNLVRDNYSFADYIKFEDIFEGTDFSKVASKFEILKKRITENKSCEDVVAEIKGLDVNVRKSFHETYKNDLVKLFGGDFPNSSFVLAEDALFNRNFHPIVSQYNKVTDAYKTGIIDEAVENELLKLSKEADIDSRKTFYNKYSSDLNPSLRRKIRDALRRDYFEVLISEDKYKNILSFYNNLSNELKAAFKNDFGDNANKLAKFSDKPDLGEAWSIIKNCGDAELAKKATDISELELVASHLDDIRNAGGYQKWKTLKVDGFGPARRNSENLLGGINKDFFELKKSVWENLNSHDIRLGLASYLEDFPKEIIEKTTRYDNFAEKGFSGYAQNFGEELQQALLRTRSKDSKIHFNLNGIGQNGERSIIEILNEKPGNYFIGINITEWELQQIVYDKDFIDNTIFYLNNKTLLLAHNKEELKSIGIEYKIF